MHLEEQYEIQEGKTVISILIGNVCSLIGMLLDSFASTRKQAKNVLFSQALAQVVYTIGAIALKGYSAAVQGVISMLRNLIAMGGKTRIAVEWALLALGVVFGLVFNNRGWWGLLPIIANLEYSLAVLKFKNDERKLKIAFSAMVVLFAAFNMVLYNIVGVFTNAITLTVTLIDVFKKNRE